MEQKPSITGCAMNAALETTLAVELFLNENYRFRRNVLNGKVDSAVWHHLRPLRSYVTSVLPLYYLYVRYPSEHCAHKSFKIN